MLNRIFNDSETEMWVNILIAVEPFYILGEIGSDLLLINISTAVGTISLIMALIRFIISFKRQPSIHKRLVKTVNGLFFPYVCVISGFILIQHGDRGIGEIWLAGIFTLVYLLSNTFIKSENRNSQDN